MYKNIRLRIETYKRLEEVARKRGLKLIDVADTAIHLLHFVVFNNVNLDDILYAALRGDKELFDKLYTLILR